MKTPLKIHYFNWILVLKSKINENELKISKS